jgi:hypothetical protein
MNYLYCAIITAFACATLFIALSTQKGEKYRKLYSQLNDKQKKIYVKIIKERSVINVKGYVIGAIISYLLFRNAKNINNRNCVIAATAAFIHYMYYTLTPKSDYILNHLNTPEQNKAWVEMYKHMKFRYHFGFLFGIVSYFFILKYFESK